MKSVELPVVAAIPAYNEEQTVGGLLSQVLEDRYDGVYLLDDASSDDTVGVAESFGKDVKVIRTWENVGAGANRNQIIPALGKQALIHFIDADVRLNSTDNPEIIREITAPEGIGTVSGIVRLPDGSQNPWNYGPRWSIPQMVSSGMWATIYSLGRKNPELAKAIRKPLDKAWPMIEQWPDTFSPAESRDVFWGSEANMAIDSDTLERVGGFDNRLRYHETMELAIKLGRIGLKNRFDPRLDVTHHDMALLNKSNTRQFWSAIAQIALETGIKDSFAVR